jgi:hypothetical protein
MTSFSGDQRYMAIRGETAMKRRMAYCTRRCATTERLVTRTPLSRDLVDLVPAARRMRTRMNSVCRRECFWNVFNMKFK